MARRSGAGERARVEVVAARGFSDAQIAAQLGRGRATIWREEKRCAPGACCAVGAQARADAAAGRPRLPKPAADAGLGRLVQGRPKERLSPHVISAERGGLGCKVCAETIYRACYADCGRSGLAAGSWAELPRSRQRRKPRRRCEQAKRSALGDYRPIADRPASPSSKTASTTCPANSTGGTQPKPSTMNPVATTNRACRPSSHAHPSRIRGPMDAN